MGLCCCTWAFFSCEWQLVSSYSVRAFHCGGFSCCEAWAVEHAGSAVVAPGPSGSVARRIFPEPVSPVLAGR